MTNYQVIDRINELLDSTDDQTVNTSMRIPSALRDRRRSRSMNLTWPHPPPC